MRKYFTIGHSNDSIEEFLGRLNSHCVSSVADVRSTPMSRFAPHFNREVLRISLREHGVRYAFLGAELGARSEDPSCYEDGRVQYGRLAATDIFRDGIVRLESANAEEVIAIMCTERDPLCCHRTILVARTLVERGHSVEHILGDGSLESHDVAMQRLILETKVAQASLLEPEDEPLHRALALRELEIAYVRNQPESSTAIAG
jgi:uncharacterized protein (DUF488 family)